MESVKVMVRCRPMNQREKTLKCREIVCIDCANAHCTLINPAEPNAPPKCFTFDGAYGDNSSTEQIYNDIVFSIVESVTEGYNGTVFAYGQTGCGKSFSMQGVSNPTSQRGIIPRSFEHIFEATAAATDTKYLVNASYLEIYNEEIRDLLASDSKKKYDIKENPETGVYIPGLSLHTVNSVTECEAVMEQGWKNRTVGATLMNADSSRSHSIFTIHVEQMETGRGKHIRKGKLNLVDLAGSERQCKTGATGNRLKEATKINLSLSALGNVISALVDGKAKHIPYRDSKLTRLLQDSLGGNTKTLMVACLSPADNNYDETLSTLRYANRAKNIKNKPKVNEDPKDALLREYKEELERLKKLLIDQVSGNPPPAPLQSRENLLGRTQMNKDMSAFMDASKANDEHVTLQIEDLRQRFEQEKRAKNKLIEDMNQLREFYERKLQQQKDDPNAADGDRDSPEIKHLIQDATNVKIEDEPALMEQMQTTALQRLQELQRKIVGGEKADDQELRRKREKRKNYAERRIRAMAEVLAKIDGSDENMPDYEDMNAQLEHKTLVLKRAKKKIQSLETEIKDLQEEFERERTDYLDTIRRQEKALKLQARILDKVQGVIRRDCNYTNLEQIRSQARWDEDLQNWLLPDVNIENIRLPLANGNVNTLNGGNNDATNTLREDNNSTSSHCSGGRKGGSSTRSLKGSLTNGWLDGFYSSPNEQTPHIKNGHLFFSNGSSSSIVANANPHDSNNNQVVSNSTAQGRVDGMSVLSAKQQLNDDNLEIQINGKNVSPTVSAQGLFAAAVVAARSRSLPNKKNGSGTISPDSGFLVRRPARLESLGANGEELTLADPPTGPRGRRRSRTYEDLLDAWPAV
ncbi:osmotic avoidance abnormal protein 3-like isoform X2 [Varroa jacobsoni]|uniref:osmotic avoidance abnormal protein 3-like isoform X2 n=1 Tax=Varroa jacobsoni TaxID=62625 RepID=UPI000BF81941|nr:osmotic avoidance abnormal protein 3-like isoform X2 [Varroa jacobsoni]